MISYHPVAVWGFCVPTNKYEVAKRGESTLGGGHLPAQPGRGKGFLGKGGIDSTQGAAQASQ